eukprot:GHVU01199107.1.p1 GENE.GHVU01199107.1~~GHVU01199107.1.p1  ORF type:complete len:983 (-),score=97.24 GHVU01199107.1:360-3161(-)
MQTVGGTGCPADASLFSRRQLCMALVLSVFSLSLRPMVPQILVDVVMELWTNMRWVRDTLTWENIAFVVENHFRGRQIDWIPPQEAITRVQLRVMEDDGGNDPPEIARRRNPLSVISTSSSVRGSVEGGGSIPPPPPPVSFRALANVPQHELEQRASEPPVINRRVYSINGDARSGIVPLLGVVPTTASGPVDYSAVHAWSDSGAVAPGHPRGGPSRERQGRPMQRVESHRGTMQPPNPINQAGSRPARPRSRQGRPVGESIGVWDRLRQYQTDYPHLVLCGEPADGGSQISWYDREPAGRDRLVRGARHVPGRHHLWSEYPSSGAIWRSGMMGREGSQHVNDRHHFYATAAQEYGAYVHGEVCLRRQDSVLSEDGAMFFWQQMGKLPIQDTDENNLRLTVDMAIDFMHDERRWWYETPVDQLLHFDGRYLTRKLRYDILSINWRRPWALRTIREVGFIPAGITDVDFPNGAALTMEQVNTEWDAFQERRTRALANGARIPAVFANREEVFMTLPPPDANMNEALDEGTYNRRRWRRGREEGGAVGSGSARSVSRHNDDDPNPLTGSNRQHSRAGSERGGPSGWPPTREGSERGGTSGAQASMVVDPPPAVANAVNDVTTGGMGVSTETNAVTTGGTASANPPQDVEMVPVETTTAAVPHRSPMVQGGGGMRTTPTMMVDHLGRDKSPEPGSLEELVDVMNRPVTRFVPRPAHLQADGTGMDPRVVEVISEQDEEEGEGEPARIASLQDATVTGPTAGFTPANEAPVTDVVWGPLGLQTPVHAANTGCRPATSSAQLPSPPNSDDITMHGDTDQPFPPVDPLTFSADGSSGSQHSGRITRSQSGTGDKRRLSQPGEKAMPGKMPKREATSQVATGASPGTPRRIGPPRGAKLPPPKEGEDNRCVQVDETCMLSHVTSVNELYRLAEENAVAEA